MEHGPDAHLLDLLNTESAGYLETEGMEHTWEISQDQLATEVAVQSAKKRFDLRLDTGGQYTCDYTMDGRFLLLAGDKGHVAATEWERGKLLCELELEETVRAAKWLHNASMFAVAQQQYVYIYDAQGTEVHRLAKHLQAEHLEYAPYHYLLCSADARGLLCYQDMTHGQVVAEHQTRAGRCRSLRQNLANGVIHLGHADGRVTLWSPAISGPLVTMQCHISPVQAIAIDPQGHYMATSGLDGFLRIWDLRTWRKLHEYLPTRPATSLDISQRGVLAASSGAHVSTWREGLAQKAQQIYLRHTDPGSTFRTVRFCPYDDVLGVAGSKGFSSILIPGAGEPNYDSFEANPLASRQQRRETEVKKLLEKLPPETIMLNPDTIGTVARTEEERHAIKADAEFVAAARNPKAKRPKKAPRGPRKQQLEREKRRQNIITGEGGPGRHVVTAERPQEPARRTALDRFKSRAA